MSPRIKQDASCLHCGLSRLESHRAQWNKRPIKCVTPRHKFEGLRAVLPPADVAEVAERYAESDVGIRVLAEEFNATIGAIRKALASSGVPLGAGSHRFTPEQEERIRRLRAEGVPVRWIAEDVGFGPKVVGRVHSNPEANSEWHSVWPFIRKNPVLLDLHREFAPA